MSTPKNKASLIRASVANPQQPTLVAEYDAEPGAAQIPERDPTLTIRAPGPVASRRGRNARVVSKRPNTLTSKLNRLSSGVFKRGNPVRE